MAVQSKKEKEVKEIKRPDQQTALTDITKRIRHIKKGWEYPALS